MHVICLWGVSLKLVDTFQNHEVSHRLITQGRRCGIFSAKRTSGVRFICDRIGFLLVKYNSTSTPRSYSLK